jgi:ABC-type branched-subunit amino acid transport system substrate-binding protein
LLASHQSRRRGRRAASSALVGIALVITAGCGARWDDSQQKSVLARYKGGTSAQASSALAPGDGDGATTGAAAEATATTVPGSPSGGSSPAAGGPATPAATGAKPCAAPSTAPGVTAKEITLGTVSTVSGAVPGLGQSSLAAAQAYVAYRNATGGVCGRKLVLKSADDGMDNGRFRSLMSEMGPKVLGFMGGIGGGDAGGAEVVTAQKIPVVNTPISDQFQNAPTVFDINPPFPRPDVVIGKYRFIKSQGGDKAAVLYPGVDQTRSEAAKQKAQMKAAGIDVVLDKEYPLSTLSYDSLARAVANSKATYLFLMSEPAQSASMAQAMRDTGYQLKFQEYLTTYGSNFTELAGSAAEGTSNWIRSLPTEEAASSPEASTFVKWMRQTAPDQPADVFAADSWAASKAFVDSLDGLPGPITRDALLAKLRSVATYDAGGLIGPIKLGPKQNNGCFIGMKVVGGKWKRFAPAKGFLC